MMSKLTFHTTLFFFINIERVNKQKPKDLRFASSLPGQSLKNDPVHQGPVRDRDDPDPEMRPRLQLEAVQALVQGGRHRGRRRDLECNSFSL